ncbi:MAG: GGDEF domain-containing protein, partial [Iodobacter sp.]
DQEYQHGNSVSRLTTTPDYWRLDCQLNPGYRSPFCSLDLDLSHGDQGIDLSEFDQITIQYRYQKLREQINLVMVNFNPAYSKTNQYESQKFNELFLPGAPGWVKHDVSASQFNVAAWWITNSHMDPKWGENEFSNIREIRLATGLYPQEKQHQIDLAYIEFTGKWISAHNLYLILLILWGSSATLWLITEWRRTLQALNRSKVRQQQLENKKQNLQEKNKLLEKTAMLDPLTQTFNRAWLNSFLTSAAPDLQFSIIFIDIDHFKQINDGHGHGTGDQVLSQLALHIQSHIRPGEKLVRLGGEEFILLCLSCPLNQAVLLAEKLRLSIFNHSWPAGIALTSSFGVAEQQPTESFTETLHRADTALYRAKAAGRNRVEQATDT